MAEVQSMERNPFFFGNVNFYNIVLEQSISHLVRRQGRLPQ